MNENLFKNGDPINILEFLEQSQHVVDKAAAENALKTIVPIIRELIGSKKLKASRQVILNVTFRTYNKLHTKYNISDTKLETFLKEKIAELNEANNQTSYEILYAMLQADIGKFELNVHQLFETCLQGLYKCKAENESQILIILRCLNLLLKRNPTLEPHIKLFQVYDYLQMNQNGLREEVLIYFNHCCKPIEQARTYFQLILAHYAWTNRNKYFLLSAILNTHNLDELLKYTQNNAKDFFNGLRLSLGYKRLLPCSQYLIKSLSNQESQGLIELAATILTVGTLKEILNFHAHWFNKIQQQEKLFQLIYESTEIANAFEMYKMHKNATEEYRLILIFSIYSRYIFNTSKLVYFKISTELIMNCFNYRNESQILIYKFIIDNLNSFALEDSLEYLANFIQHHKNIENAQMRTNMLSKISSIINYVAKAYRKSCKQQKNEFNTLNSLSISICDFFNKLTKLIVENIENVVYQPKIFALKLLDVLLKSLYQTSLEKNAKTCIINENKILGEFLLKENVFNANEVKSKLINALNDPTGFDDALNLIAHLLNRMQNVELNEIMTKCKACCENVDIDICALSTKYALVSLNIDQMNFMTLYKYAMEKLLEVFNDFQHDALNTCKTRCHIFGYLNVINLSIAYANDKYVCTKYEELLEMLERMLNLVLAFLKSPLICNKELMPIAASFQDMDKSLELLVEASNFRTDNHVECRKFLLMSFWLTLKACCDTATTLACILTPPDKELVELEKLRRCLNINVAVLSRCRHKGAIEAAGLSIGKLTKHLTSHKYSLNDINKILCDALSVLFPTENLVSTTRRGAGFSIMFLHIMKNDQQIEKPLLKHAINKIFKLLEENSQNVPITPIHNYDRIESLCLHYLCVLAKDAELRDTVAEYRNEIILAAITKIDNCDWTICNAALQLFGALVPKIVGQKQATDFEVESIWEPNDVCFISTAASMPKSFDFILNYCSENSSKTNCTRSLILFLEFLSKLEHLAQDDDSQKTEQFMLRLRELMWLLLKHCDEKVRKLSALCFVRAHEFSYELPQMLLKICDLLFHVRNENFFIGLIFVIQAGYSKMQNEAIYTLSEVLLSSYFQTLRLAISTNFIELNFKLYTQTKLLEMLYNIGFDNETNIVNSLIKSLQLSAKKSNLDITYNELLQESFYMRKFNEFDAKCETKIENKF